MAMVSIPAGVTAAAWLEATNKAAGDRVRLAKLVAAGKVMRVRGQYQLALPPINARGLDTIRPNPKNRKRR